MSSNDRPLEEAHHIEEAHPLEEAHFDINNYPEFYTCTHCGKVGEAVTQGLCHSCFPVHSLHAMMMSGRRDRERRQVEEIAARDRWQVEEIASAREYIQTLPCIECSNPTLPDHIYCAEHLPPPCIKCGHQSMSGQQVCSIHF